MLSPDELRRAIATENLVQLCKVPGIGRKGAQRIVIELKDKINAVAQTEETVSAVGLARSLARQVAQGLQGLGWSARDADAACDEVEHLAREDPHANVAVLMRAALQSLARKVGEPMSPVSDEDLAALVRPDRRSRGARRRVRAPSHDAGRVRRPVARKRSTRAGPRGGQARGGVPDHVLLSGPPGSARQLWR